MNQQQILSIKPTKGRVLIKLKSPESNFGNLVIPSNAIRKENAGTIVSSYAGCELPTNANVIFEADLDHTMEVEGADYLFVNEENIMCILED